MNTPWVPAWMQDQPWRKTQGWDVFPGGGGARALEMSALAVLLLPVARARAVLGNTHLQRDKVSLGSF